MCIRDMLIARGVLVKEPGVTEWCSPAVWVPKGDNVRVRLCTDYRELNKLVEPHSSSDFRTDNIVAFRSLAVFVIYVFFRGS